MGQSNSGSASRKIEKTEEAPIMESTTSDQRGFHSMEQSNSKTEEAPIMESTTSDQKAHTSDEPAHVLGVFDHISSDRTKHFIMELQQQLSHDHITLKSYENDETASQNAIIICDFHSRPGEDMSNIDNYKKQDNRKLMLVGICKEGQESKMEEFVSEKIKDLQNIDNDKFVVTTFYGSESDPWIRTWKSIKDLQQIQTFAGTDAKRIRLQNARSVCFYGICCGYFCFGGK